MDPFLFSHYRAIRERAALVDRSGMGRLWLTGRDRASYLQGLLSQDILALSPGAGCYATYLTPQGRMIADMHVLDLGDGLLVTLPGQVAGVVRDRFDELVFSEDVQVEDRTATWASYSLYGRDAAPALAMALGAGASGDLATGLAKWPPWRTERHGLGSASVVIAASDEIGVAGFDVHVARAEQGGVEAALAAAGAERVTPEAVTIVRVESGLPEFGADMDHETIPLEAGIEDRAISFTKGCYVGQEVIVRVRDRGHGRVVRRLVGLSVDGSTVPARGDLVHAGDREVGRITSAVFSPALGAPIALGYVHRDFVEPGVGLLISHGGVRLEAAVAALPFVR